MIHMSNLDSFKAIQSILRNAGYYHGAIDGLFGKQSQAAFQACADAALTEYHANVPPSQSDNGVHPAKASSFADPADVSAFHHCKAQGGSDNTCFKVGDNGIGIGGLDCTDVSILYVALPPEDWMTQFGSWRAAQGKPVILTINDRELTCILGDTMPHRHNITNGAGVDCAPGTQAAAGLTAPFLVSATWRWAE